MKTKVGYIIFVPVMILMFGALGFVVKGQVDNSKTIARIDERTKALPQIQETLHEHMLTQEALIRSLPAPVNLREKKGGGTP